MYKLKALFKTRQGHKILAIVGVTIGIPIAATTYVITSNNFIDIDESAQTTPTIDTTNKTKASVQYAVEQVVGGWFAPKDVSGAEDDEETGQVDNAAQANNAPASEYDPSSAPTGDQQQQSVSYANVRTEGGGVGIDHLIQGWLQVYDGPTKAGDAYEVAIPSTYTPHKWAMGEGNAALNSYAVNKYSDRTQNTGPGGKGAVNSTGRYWVATGPSVCNQNFHCDESRRGADIGEWGLPKEYDVVLTDGTHTYYLPCVTGDTKAHTYPTGIVQTGIHVHHTEDLSSGHNDSSIVEFCKVAPSAASNLGNELEIVKIIVYK